MLLRPSVPGLSNIKDVPKKLYFLFILVLILSNVAISADDWPDCNFHCNAGDVTLLNAYLGDASGNPLPSCISGSPVTAYLWITIYNNANSDRYAAILLADVYINNNLAYTTYPDGLCVLDAIPAKATSKYAIYSFPWTCGQSVYLSRMVLSWETKSGTECSSADRKCANRGTKCYGGSLSVVPMQMPLIADFNSSSPQCCCSISFYNNSRGGVPPYTFKWNFGDGTAASTQPNPTHTYSSPGTYSVTISVKDSAGTSTSTTKQVTLYSHPIAEAGNNLSITPGSSVFLGGSASGGSPPYKFSWSPSSGLSSPSAPNSLASPANTTRYTLTVTDSHGCTGSDSMTLYVSSIKVTKSASNSLVQAGSQVTYTYKVQNTGTSDLKLQSLIDSYFGGISGTPAGDTNGDNLLNPGEIWTYQAIYRIYRNTTNYATVSVIDPKAMIVNSSSAVVVVNVISSKDLPSCTIQGNNVTCIATPSTYTYKVGGQPITKYQSTWLIDGSAINGANADGSITLNWTRYGSGYHQVQLTTDFLDDQGNVWRSSLCGMKVMVVNIPSADIKIL